MYKFLLVITIIISLLLNSTGQALAPLYSRSEGGYALRPMAAAVSVFNFENEEAIQKIKELMLNSMEDDKAGLQVELRKGKLFFTYTTIIVVARK